MGKKRKAVTSLFVRQARKRAEVKKLVIATFDTDASPICVVRPTKPDVAIKYMAVYASKTEREKKALYERHMQELHDAAGPYDYIGYFTLNKDEQGERILAGGDGEYVGTLRKGDMLVHESSIEEVEGS